MTYESSESNLRNFFGGVFHQDWMLETDSWEVAVQRYVGKHPDHRHLRLLASQIEALTQAGLADDALARRLSHDLACSYSPDESETLPGWLHSVALALKRAATLNDR